MDQSIKKKYNYWQWRTLIILMIDPIKSLTFLIIIIVLQQRPLLEQKSRNRIQIIVAMKNITISWLYASRQVS